MTVITTKLHTEGMLVSSDSLDLKVDDNKIITEEPDDNFIKVRPVTKHAVIGISGAGAELNSSKFASYAEEIRNLIEKFPANVPKTMKNISEVAAQYLAKKIPTDNKPGYTLEALVAGYSYDKDNKPTGAPEAYLIGNDFVATLDPHDYSGVPSRVREMSKVIANRIVGHDIYVIDGLKKTIERTDETMFYLSAFEEIGHTGEGHMGGKIRRWNITKDGIDPSSGATLTVFARKGKDLSHVEPPPKPSEYAAKLRMMLAQAAGV